MGSHGNFMIFMLIAALVPITTLGREYIVGDESGWTFNFDYQTWAQGKNFQVGDKLVFKYPVGFHNVFRVNGTGFQNCIIPPIEQALTSGNDTIALAAPGKKWYICGVAKHCENGGQKLAINVVNSQLPFFPAPTIAPSPSTGASADKETRFLNFFRW
ncbi:blue copper protein-like [Mercurialis annua]|uniref:blue copper protein-like n=1 Tax=Mercurialis annua TaxID=3986 RepID=UPI0024AF9E5A|nr:blue copper protein-like [Mercurialis annua]